jgi:hypothetical protein
LKKATIEQHMSSIRSTLVDHAVPAPLQTGMLARVLRGVSHNPLGAPQRPAALPRLPITAQVLAGMRPFIAHQSWSGALLWLACLLGTAGLLRSGEFTVDTDLPESERQRRLVRVRHLSLAGDGASMTLRIPVSKTSPVDGVTVVYARVADAAMCPIAAWRAYAAVRLGQPARAQWHDDAPLLLTERGEALRKRELVDHMRLVLRASGIEDESTLQRFSGHSFRRGGAQTLRDGGMPVAQIQTAGRWRSNAVQRYFSDTAAVASAVAPMFAAAVDAAPAAAAVEGAEPLPATHLPLAQFDDFELEPAADGSQARPSAAALDADAAPAQPASDATTRARTRPMQAVGAGGQTWHFQLKASEEALWGEER